jgi:outer membrane lipoprotein-sorting protein
MNLKWVPAVVLVMAGLLTGSFGCKSGSTTPAVPGTSAATTKAAVTTATKAPAATSVPSSGKTLADILGRASGIASVRYDMVITAPGAQPMTQKIWVKKNKMRTEIAQQGQATVLLADMDARTMYTYVPAQNTAIKMAFDPTNKSAVGESQ